MKRLLFPGLLILTGSTLMAQTISGDSAVTPLPGGLLEPATAASPTPSDEKKPAAQAPSGPTTIDSDAMDYDEKTRVAVFTGDNYGVYLKDPQFAVNCNKLTAYMRKAGAASNISKPAVKGAKPSATPAPSPGKADAAASKASGLQRAIAEGTADQPVVIVQDKPATSGTDQPQHNVGIAQMADYNADTGDIKLTGWPRVSQGVNTQIATSAATYMIMNKDGHTMKTFGPSRSTIQQSGQDQGKKKDDSSSSPQ